MSVKKPAIRGGCPIIFVKNNTFNRQIVDSIAQQIKKKYENHILMIRGRGPQKLRDNFNNIKLSDAPYLALVARNVIKFEGGLSTTSVKHPQIEAFVSEKLIKAGVITREEYNQHVILREHFSKKRLRKAILAPI